MPIIMGEGRHAFRRLQEEIMKRTNDQSLLAWGYTPVDRRTDFPSNGFFARTPWAFSQSRIIVPYPQWPNETPWDITAKGVRMDAPMIDASGIVDNVDMLMALGCHLEDNDRDVLAICLLNIQGDVYKRQFKTPVLVQRDVWMKKKSVTQTIFIQPSNLDNRLAWDENKHAIDIVIIFRFCPLSRRGYRISKTEPPGFWDEKSSRLRMKQSSSDVKGNRVWNVILHLIDDEGNDRFCIRVESQSIDKLTFSIHSMVEMQESIFVEIDDHNRSHICKVEDETFDFQAMFKGIWCGEVTVIVNFDIWSVAQLRDGLIRQIRESAEEIRHTGLLGRSSEGQRMMMRRANTTSLNTIKRTNTMDSMVLKRSSTLKTILENPKRRSWMFWIK
jgi:hypothetical protein